VNGGYALAVAAVSDKGLGGGASDKVVYSKWLNRDS